MISSLRGTVTSLTASQCTIEINGVGYQVNITTDHAHSLSLNDTVFLHACLIVREDSMTLFGFETAEAKEIFEVLISVSGVGPRSALSVLNVLSPVQIISAVIDEDDTAFKKVSGIGPKTAKLIVVQLSGKLNLSEQSSPTSQKTELAESVVTALVGLGWNDGVARKAVSDVQAEHSDAASLLRATLSILSSGVK